VEKQVAPPVPVAAVASNKLFVDNNLLRDNLFDIETDSQSIKNTSGKRS
jgi:hypothetical protein